MVCSCFVMVARWAAHAWTESDDWVWLSSTGFDLSIKATSESRFLRASIARLVVPFDQPGQFRAEPAERDVALVDDGFQVVARDRVDRPRLVAASSELMSGGT